MRRLVPLAASLASLLLAGCGGGQGDALGTVTAAVHTSLGQVPIARLLLSKPLAFGGSPTQVNGLGAFIFQLGLGYERVELPGPHDANGRPQRDFLDFLPAEIDIYPAAQAALPVGKRWISVRLSTPAGPHAARFVEQAEAVAPRLWLDEILWGGVSAKSIGGIVVNHVPFSRYRVAIDLRRSLAAAKRHGEQGVTIALREQLAALGGRAIVQVLVWRDGEGRVARLEGTVAGTELGAIRLDLYGYGVKLKQIRPPRSQLVPFVSVLASKAWSSHSPWVFAAT